jgi:hypothetical protein
VVDALQVGDVLEHEGVVDGDLAPDPLVHGVDERLQHGRTQFANVQYNCANNNQLCKTNNTKQK